jgi:hypothetical protein
MKISKTAVSVAVVGAIAAAVLPVSLQSAGASTTACGTWCTSPSNQSAGTGEVLTVSGSSIVMAAASTTNSAQDWTAEGEGEVSTAVTAGVLSGKLDMQYSGDTLLEYQYAPNGVPSGQCLADNSNDPTIGNDSSPIYTPTLTVVLAQCGVTAQSLWIVDQNNEANGYVDLINAGYETSYSYLASNSSVFLPLTSPYAEPAVLTVNSSGKVVLAQLSEIGQTASPTQMWENFLAPSQSSLAQKIAKASTVGS